MSRVWLIVISCLLVSACTYGAQPVVTPGPATLAPQSLAQIDLQTLVIQPDDLPPMDAIPEVVSGFDGPHAGIATSFVRLLKKERKYVLGSIYVHVYVDTTDATKEYEANSALLRTPYSDQFGYQFEMPTVGEHALLSYRGTEADVSIVMQRCHASISIRLPASKEATLAYAQRLDARLTPFVCP